MSALLLASEAHEVVLDTFPILAAIILVPVAGAALIGLMPRARPDLSRRSPSRRPSSPAR